MSATEQQTLLIVLCIAVLAPVLADLVPRVRLPVVVLEITLGILVGPQALACAQPGPTVSR
jgi:Kef-type K+ transport system membrane component KefB